MVSQSEINTFEKCGQKDAFRKGGIPSLPGTAALRGTSVHAAANYNHQQKITSGRDLPVEELVEVAASTFTERRHTEGVMLTPDEVKVGLKPSLARGRMSAMDLTRVYHERVAPGLQPRFSEKRIAASIGDGVILRGQIDVLTVEHDHHDLKTTGGSFSQATADESHQATVYDLLIRAETGTRPRSHTFDVLNAKTLKHTPMRTVRDENDIRVLVNRINAMIATRKAGVVSPAPLGAWWCSPTWCGYWTICPFVNSERKAAAE